MRDHYICMSNFVLTSRGTEGSNCRPRNDSSRLHISPLPKNMNPVTSQKTRGSWGETDAGIKGRMRIRSNSNFFFSFELIPSFLFDCVSLTTKLNKTKSQSKILITENWHIWFWLHLLKGRLQIHPKGHSDQTEQGQGEGAHRQLQVQAHHHVTMAGWNMKGLIILK